LVVLFSLTHSLCHTIGTLRDDIKKQAEAMNEDSLTKFEYAKMRLETSRGKAREIAEGMRKTSDSKVNVRLPWVLSEDGLVLLPHRAPTKTPEKIPNSTKKCLSVVTPSPWPAIASLHFDTDPKDEGSTSGPKRCDPGGLLTPPTTAHPHSPTFEKYEKMMDDIRSRSPGPVWPWDIPWPVLPRSVHNFPVKSNHSLLARDVVGNSVKQFIESYVSWKAHPIHRVRAKMLADWKSIVDMTPFWKARQKEMVELLVHHLSDSV